MTRIQFVFVKKIPQQERSRRMVERIVEAGHAVLVTDGYDALSTNRVAAEAGISPGSLYQYFPNKDEVIAAVVERYSDQLAEQITASLADRIDDAGPAMVRPTIEALLDALEENAEFLRVIADEIPRAENSSRLEALEQRIVGLVGAYLSARRAELGDTRPSTAAWVLVRAIEHLTVRYVLERPAVGRDEFVSELVKLVAGYLPEV